MAQPDKIAHEMMAAGMKELADEDIDWKERVEELERALGIEIRSMAIAYHTLHERPNEPTAVMVEGFEKCAHRVCYHADKVLSKLRRAALSKQELPFEPNGPNPAFEPREPCATCGGIGEVWNGQRGERFDMVQCKKCGGDGSTPNTEGRDG